jgi:DNA-binding response OmpR family regulator
VATETILVVEDNRQLAKFIATILLPDLGYEAAIAHDGKSAKEILKTIQPSLMLLDFELPDTNGLDLLRQLSNEGRNIPTILFTSYGS